MHVRFVAQMEYFKNWTALLLSLKKITWISFDNTYSIWPLFTIDTG